MRGGGIVKRKKSKKYNPSVSFAASSLYTREPFDKSSFTYKSIKKLLSESRLRLPSPVGEGAELAEADEVFSA